MKTIIAFAISSFGSGRARSRLRAAARTECPPYLLLVAILMLAAPARAATNDLTSTLQRGLFEEQANQNLGAAIQAYEAVASQFDKDRKLAATAIFRLGECYRKQGNTNAAAVQFERILREFSDQPTLVTLSRQTLAALGSAPAAVTAAPGLSEAARQEQKRLLEEEIKLVQKQLEMQKRQVEAGIIPSDAIVPTERDLLKLKRQVAALDAGQPISFAAAEISAPAASSEADEVRRLQALIQDSPDLINAPDSKGETLLQSAAAKGNLAVVKLLLDNGAAVDGLQQPGLTALHFAAGNGHKAIVDLLVAKGAKPGAQTGGGVTALHLAARKGYESVAKALLAAGAPVNAKTTASEVRDYPVTALPYRLTTVGQTPLHLAAAAGYAGLVESLLAKGAEVNLVDEAGRTPLSYAVDKHYLPVVQLLVTAHANPNAGSSHLPLTLAAFYGDMPALKLLLANGADPNLSTKLNADYYNRVYGLTSVGGNATPLTAAVSQKHPDAVAELIQAKADPNGSTADGYPLIFSALSDHPTLKALLEGGANPNLLDREARSPLLSAVMMQGGQPAVELLLGHKAHVNVGRAGYGWTPLHEAANRGNKAIAELLLKAGADVNARDRGGSTPLYRAVANKHLETAEFLLTNHADPNAKDNSGQTPLHDAVLNRTQDLAELLLANKADPNERDNKGCTPLDLAKSQSQPVGPGGALNPAIRPGLPGRVPPGGVPIAPAAQEQERKSETMADLLRRHGALDDLPYLDRIGVRRSATAFSEVPFAKGAQDWNQFTLLELIAVQYKLLASSPKDGGGASYAASALFGDSRLPFPDLAHLHISRPTSNLKSWQDQVVDLRPVLESGDCAKDARLTWGDVVEIPEADHPLNEKWGGFSAAQLANLKQCLTRKVDIVIKGQTTTITLAPRIMGLEEGHEGKTPVASGVPSQPGALPGFQYQPTIYPSTPFWLKPVLLQSKLVLVSSDLARVKVTRRDPATGQQREWEVDCSEASPAPDFWLKDGDRIEVPEKTYSSAASKAGAPQPAVAEGAPVFTPPQPSSRRGVPPPTRTLRVPPAPPNQAVGPPAYALPPAQPPPPVAVDPATGLPARQAETGTAQRLANVIERLPPAETPEDAEGQYLVVGSVFYSPKPEDSRLLNAGYHKDRSDKTRQAECWEKRATAELQGRAGNAVWTGTDMVVFGGEGMGTSLDDGARYCLAEDTWAMLPEQGAPSSRTGHAMVWTGKEVIVWGGFGGVWGEDTKHNDGARYNPSSDTWKPVSTRNAPAARFDFSALWTGREMLVWGGYTDSHSRYQGAHADAYLNTGGRYDPASDSWKTITTKGAPFRRSFNSAVWTGKEMLVWGGANTSKVLADGARYDPAKDSWKPISPDGAPSPRAGHVAVWTGKEMIVWGGSAREPSAPSDYLETGARYDPATDTWKPLSTIGAPKGRVNTFAVWTGTEMVLWGGVNDAQVGQGGEGSRFVGTGARYNPATDTWTEITPTGAPSPRLTSGIWTGDALLAFGGYDGRHLNETWCYSPTRTLYPYAKR